MSFAVISDIHGCYLTLKALVDKIPKTHQIVFAGDLIDRGPRSKQVIQYAIDNKIPSVLGNHDDLLLVYEGVVKYPDITGDVWLMNGALQTLDSYGGKVRKDHIEWLASLPLYLEYGDLMVSHTGHGLNPDRMHALWGRDRNFPRDGRFRVFGHTPEKEVRITDEWAMIDTGCAYKRHGMGVLSCLLYPEMKVISQEFND